MENIAGSEEQQSQSEASDDKPGLSQIRKSWGFRRSTLARREFMEEVGDLSHSPPPLRRVRGRCLTRTTMACKDNKGVESPQESRTVIEDLEWSASCSPVSEETKPAVASAGGCLDPSMWQDIGSAFHTAFTLLGGDEDLSMEMSRALAVTDSLGVGNATEAAPPQAADDTEVSELRGPTDSVGISHPVASDQVAQVDVDNVLLISSQEEDSDDMPLIQTKEQLDSKAKQGGRAGRGGRGKARGRWRGRGKGKGRGRGRGRAKTVEVASIAVDDDDDDDDDVILVNPPDTLSVMTLTPIQQTRSDFIIVDTDVDQNSDTTSGQCDDAPEEEEGKQGDSVIKNVTEYSSLSDSKGYDPNALYCICRQKHNKRFMISCNSCQEYFHGDCVGISEAEGCKEYICPPCTTKQMSQFPSECHSQAEPEISPESLSLSPSGEEPEGKEEWEPLKTVDLEANDIEEVPAIRTEPGPEPEGEIETDCSGSLCIGPGCSKPALQDSVYCGTDCIVQHAAVTMKSLSDTKVPNPRGQVQRKATPIIPTAKGQCSSRVSARLAAKAEECAKEEELMETDGRQKEATSSIACDPTLTEVQATPQPSPKFYTASSTECKQIESETHQKQNSEDPSMDACPPPQLVSEPVAPQSNSHVSIKKSTKSDTSVETTEKSNPSTPPVRKKSVPSLASQSPTTLGSEHNETGAVLNSLTSYIIPKKQSGLQSSSSHMIASCQKPSVPTLLNEPRNLPVPPAPSAPPSRPSQPNNQVRQSIQRSLTSILSKRVCDCEELTMSESDAAKLVASIEMEMFNIFRNTDSKYMNKYRTIMFNLKDPRNKGLLYRVVQGDISPFRLVRMSQKDMQATKAPDHSVKDTSEVENPAAKASRLLQKPEAVKIDLSCLNVTKPEAVKVELSCLNNPKPDRRPVGNKRSLSTPTITLKNRVSEPSKGSSVPDVLTCMLKDTTSEHKAHLFDLKCKICTGQMGDEEPPNKKNRVSESSVKHYSRWRKSTGDDSPLRVPPDSPDFDYSSSAFDPSCPLIIDTSDFAVVESPASPIMDSPASPTLESPASPVMESPTSPVSDTSKTTRSKRTYTPVVIPAISTVTITRRDPRTAANRSSASSRSTSGPITTLKNQSAPYAPPTEGTCTSPSIPQLTVPPTKLLPKPILMKPSSSADPRLYGTSSRNVISESPASGETSQFLAKQEIVWKGFLNMFTVSKFATKAYLVSGSAEILRSELADSVEIGGRIMPQTVWDYVAKLKTNITKELCVIRFHPATEEEEVAYISLFSYFSSRGRFGVVSNNSRSIKDIYLVPLSAKESIPSILQPLEGPGLEKNRPNLLLGLAIIQKAKRSGSVLQEIDEKRSKVVSKDPMWIPKPPVLYGSGKLEVFQPYDPETPTNTTPPVSPPCPGSPSEFSSNTETLPSHVTSINANPTVSTSAPDASTQSTSSHIPDRKTKAPTPLSTILSTLFRKKQTTVIVSNEEHCTTNVTTVSAKVSVLSHVSGSMVDPIVQQYGQKSKVKDIEEEYTFDRPYDPEEEYDPATGYGTVSSQSKGNNNSKDSPLSKAADDDVAYDPEDDTIFQDVHCNATKPNQPKMSNCPSSTFPISTQVETQSFAKTPTQTSSLTAVPQNLPTGSIVVSAATLTEQQRMLEELNKQIEEQKRQLKEQEEALRQQREAVGMFMAHFSVTDSMMSPPSKSLPLSQVSSLQSGIIHSESKPSESKDSKPEEASNLTEVVNDPSRESQTDSQENTNAIPCLNITSVIQQDEVSHNIKENEKSSSAGEIEDSDVPYDPEDELFNEIQDDVFQVGTTKTQDSSLPRTYAAPISYHSRRRRSSPKKRSHRERDRCRSPSRRSHQCSVSHSRKHRERDRHRKSERDRSKHRTRDQSEREARHRKSHSTRRHSHDHRSPSSTRKNDLVPPEEFRASPNVTVSFEMSVEPR
ncbi:death-inducer obliterator 1 isoform X2 [Phycodurus eques]|uniref:death-inducer obliterator 1 isoform X2 n=1 Tax=Phycodurus eques TaxID=693459 RepID=UPI002ACDF174|nr:death-inducer obliterator 1 isoform X2 [Phycodurus eques]